MQSHTGTVDGALLPSAANTLNGQARRTAKKHPVRSPTFQNCHLHIVFSYSAIIFRRFFSYMCFFLFNMRLFFTDAIISYSITKINCVDSEYLYFISCFLLHFYIFPDYFRLYFNDLIFITDIFLYCLIYFLRLY